jgi:hypothetical protein
VLAFDISKFSKPLKERLAARAIGGTGDGG